MLTVNLSPFPHLATARLQLTPITEADAPALFALRSDPAVMRYINRPLAKTTDDALALIALINDMLARNEALTWALRQQGSETLVGTLGFWRIETENYRAEIGYLLHPDLQGQGLMREAMDAALQYGFANLGLHSVEAQVNPANEASIRLLKKAGFVREAYFRENYFYNGQFLDSAVYSLLTPLTTAAVY